MQLDWRSIFGLAVVIASASPVLRAARDDSYPLSTYPMFARILNKPLLTIAEGITDSGGTRRLSPALVANDEPMQAMRTLRIAGEGTRRTRKALCQSIAARVAGAPELADVRQVRIVRARFDPLTYFDGRSEPERVQSLMHCPVPGGP